MYRVVRSGCLHFTGVILLLILLLASSSCGNAGCGKGQPSTSPAYRKTLRWEAPSRFSNGAALDHSRDLSSYEIYISETGDFVSGVVPSATFAAVDPATGKPVTSFDLSNVRSRLQQGKTYFLTMRAIDKKGVKSDFAFPPARFTN